MFRIIPIIINVITGEKSNIKPLPAVDLEIRFLIGAKTGSVI